METRRDTLEGEEEKMKKIRKLFILIMCSYSFFFCVQTISMPLEVTASSGEGGAVQTTGGIVFYQDSSETNPSTTAPTLPPTGNGQSSKPAGRLPATGEVLRSSTLVAGVILLLLSLSVLFLRKKRKRGNPDES